MTAYTAVQTCSETLTANASDTVSFVDSAGNPLRYDYVQVTNLGGSTDAPIYVTTDGTTPATSGSDNGIAVNPGETAVLANRANIWYQSSRVIPVGVNQFGGGNTSPNPGAPGIVTPQTSMAGDMPNPGTTVKLISSSAVSYTVSAAG